MTDVKQKDWFDLRQLPAGFSDNPYVHYERLRRETPVYEMPGGGLFLTSHADLLRVYKDRQLFSSDKKIEFAPKFGNGLLYQHHTTSLVFNDAPLHTRVRKAIAGALSPRAVAGMETVVTTLVERLLDNMARTSDPDGLVDFSQNIPVEVIGNLLAVPSDERGPLRKWSLDILAALEPEIGAETFEAGEVAVRDFLDYLDQLVTRRRAAGVEADTDIMARLIRETDYDDGNGGNGDANLLPHELLQNAIFILNAGHETTTNLICSGIWLLSQMPEAVARLNAEPALWPVAIEEILRLESPNQLGNRRAVDSFEMGGRSWPAGTLITLCMGAANRDPAVFDNPDEFRLDRETGNRAAHSHLAFAGGVHICAGNSIARIEGQIALAGIFKRWPDLSLGDGLKRSPRVRFRGFEAMPLLLS